MTLIEMLVVTFIATALGAIGGMTIGFFDGRIAIFTVRGAAFGAVLGFFVPLVLVIAVVNWNRFRALRARGRTPKNQ